MDRASIQERFGILGTSPGLRKVIDRIYQVARTEITVLIQGESGVGKELFAQALHELSARRHRPLVIVNCGAIPEGLIEAELFGNEKGAYTGAVERRNGYFEEADGSTILLDEIGEMPQQAQVRLLRVLENGTFSRVGSSTVLKTDVRIIAATNKDLAREVEAGRFREDLYYRLSTVVIRVPALRERKEDILPIFEAFQHRFAQKYNTSVKRLNEAAQQLLVQYGWPGNVRELRNVAEQSVVLLRGDTVGPDDLSPHLRGIRAGSTNGNLLPVPQNFQGVGSEARERELVYRALLEIRLEIRELKDQMGMVLGTLKKAIAGAVSEPEARNDFLIVRDQQKGPYTLPIEDVPYEIESEEEREEEAGAVEGVAVIPTLEEVERKLITEALKRFEGNRRQTARALGISERTLYRKIKDMEEAL